MYKILIPIDGSELSLDALRHGLQLVRQGLRASFVLANVQEPASLYEIVTARDPAILHDVAEGAGAHLLQAAQALCEAAGVQHESEIASGEPANVLIDIIERHGCDAVIIGAGSEGSLSGALLGSVSQAVAHASPVPVTLVKHVLPQEVADEP
jgi:nucleotide-binding universal stress UspA family protein